MAEWIEPGLAMLLRTDAIEINVSEDRPEHVTVSVSAAADGQPLVEPYVEVDGRGGFVITLRAKVAQAVTA
jgi:hypothetical protein